MLKKIIAYHGTKKENAYNILITKQYQKSKNIGDWLGTGIYFYTELDNTILYNIRKYINEHKEYPTYNQLSISSKILVNELEYDEDEEVDLNNFEYLQKFLGLWKLFYERMRKDKRFNESKIKDGFVIDWLINETGYFKGCKLIKNIFRLDLRFKRSINNIFNEKTRIGYEIQQEFICVVDESCIKSIKEYDTEYDNKYNIIKDLTNNILMKGDEIKL